MKKILLLLIFINIVIAKPIYVGKTYEFAELDTLDEIKNYIKNNKEKLDNKQKEFIKKSKNKLENLAPNLKNEIPSAIISKRYQINSNYTTEFEIKAPDGRVLYPKGFTYNVLDYIQIPYNIIFIDGNDTKELQWLKKSKYLGNAGSKILITNGKYKDVSKALNSHIFFANDKIIQRFAIKVTPTIAKQEKNQMILYEVCIECEKEK